MMTSEELHEETIKEDGQIGRVSNNRTTIFLKKDKR